MNSLRDWMARRRGRRVGRSIERHLREPGPLAEVAATVAAVEAELAEELVRASGPRGNDGRYYFDGLVLSPAPAGDLDAYRRAIVMQARNEQERQRLREATARMVAVVQRGRRQVEAFRAGVFETARAGLDLPPRLFAYEPTVAGRPFAEVERLALSEPRALSDGASDGVDDADGSADDSGEADDGA